MTDKEILQKAKQRQKDITQKDKDYAIYYGKEHDLLLSLPHSERLTKNYKIYFSKTCSKYHIATIYSGKYVYKILFNDRRLLFNENGYYALMGKYQGQKGLHKQMLHKLAYIAFYGQPAPGMHIHHIDRDKHNNSMDNLVALTEEEHSIVHGRDVSVGRSLFSESTRKGLLSDLAQESMLARREPDSKTLLEEQVDELLEKKIEPSLTDILFSEATKTNIRKALELVDLSDNTVIAALLRLYRKEMGKRPSDTN